MSNENKTILDRYPAYNAVIGIEVHVQLKTETKIFCSCPNKFGSQPNSNICAICTGQPGTLPVLNKKAVEYGIMAALATESSIIQDCTFARKHYMYPDLPKKYQITQSDKPLCVNGRIPIIDAAGNEKFVRLIRIHMEEDAGKNIHRNTGVSWVDLNRAGTPLLEIVSHPNMKNSIEARSYLTRLHSIIRYLGISDGNMEEGSFRADINISVNKKIDSAWGTRVELKNINSFKFIVQAIEYEIERHISMLENGEKIKQETRLWDSKNQQTIFMRSKEEAQDYRYFLEPDLPALNISQAQIESIKKEMPELAHAKQKRLISSYGLSAYEAEILCDDQLIANFFEQATAACNNPKGVCNWMLRDLLGYMKEHKTTIDQISLSPESFAELIKALDQGVINSKTAQDVFKLMIQKGRGAFEIIKEQGLEQIGSADELEALVVKVIADNPSVVADYKAGNQRLFQFFIGQAMKATKGKGNPQVLQELIKKHLN